MRRVSWFKKYCTILIFSGAIGIAGSLGHNGLLQAELWFADWAQEITGPRAVPKKVVIVAIDDFSLLQAANADLSDHQTIQRLQQWPWPRSTHALVLDRLIEAGAKVVGFDLLFDTPSSYGRDDDATFADFAALERSLPAEVLREAMRHTFGTETYVVPTAKILMTEFGAAPQAAHAPHA